MTFIIEKEIPAGWEACDLRNFGSLIGGGTPSRCQLAFWDGSIPWASVKDFHDDHIFLYGTKEHISPEALASSAANLVPENTPVICTRMAVGRCALTKKPTAINQDLKAFLMKDGIDRRFFIRLLRYNGPELDKISVGSTVRGITIGDLLSHKVLRPKDSKEQARIAFILDTIDEAIAKTEAVIAKLKQVRAGMLHDLLSYGLDENGQLRDPIVHQEQFKETPLGMIPREWNVKELNECYVVPSRNGLYKKASCYGYGHRMIHMSQMFKDIIVDVSEAALVDVEPQELYRFSLEEGDVLFARRSLNLEGAGLCSLVGNLNEPTTFESSIIRVRLNRDCIIPRFAVEVLRSPIGYILRRRFIRQVAVSGVSSEDVGHFLMPCPKLPEQKKILSILYDRDNEIYINEGERKKLDFLKSGLQDDLLSGRVRVPENIMKGVATS